MFDVCIFVSSEDDKYLVYGGIGTYLGVLTRSIRNLYPQTQVYWITKSMQSNDFCEVGKEGVTKIYLSEFGDEKNTTFFQTHKSLKDDKLAKYMGFIHRVEETILKILNENKKKSILLEVGEWEGQAYSLFSLINRLNLLKVTRLHTPLAVCFTQNHLKESGTNYLQMLNEYNQIKKADVISSCTNYMKQRVIQDLLGNSHPLAQKIITLPNPVDISAYRTELYSRKASIDFLQKIRPDSIGTETFNVFVVGSVESRKGVEYVVKAIPRMSEAIAELRVCFLGHHATVEGEWSTANTKLLPKYLYRMIPEKYHQNMIFFNYISHADLPLAIAGGDVFPFLSVGDNFPGSVAEVGLSAKPIIALERGGVKEMLENKEGRCMAYSIGNELETASEKLAQAVETLYHNPTLRKKMGMELRDHFCEKYAPDYLVPVLMNTYWNEFVKIRNKKKAESSLYEIHLPIFSSFAETCPVK